jgi:hypothetical protein
MSVPDCTLTTGCFCVHNKNKNAFNVDQIIENVDDLMKIPVYLVINCDETTYPILYRLRNNYDLNHLTKYNVINLQDIWTYQFEEQVNKNREIFWGSRDPRAGTDSHLITSNKFDFVLKTIESNPFQTSKFGWIDSFVRKNFSKIAGNYTPNLLPYVLSQITDKFHIQILNVNDKKYKLSEYKREFYQQYRYVICGCLFTCGKEIGIKILKRAKEIFVESTNAGYGHSEEMFYLEILDEFYDDIHRSYGDYGQIINNFINPTHNFYYIYCMILKRYFDFQYFKECYDCGKILLEEIQNHRALDVGHDTHFLIAFHYCLATFQYKPSEAKEIALYIFDICKKIPGVKKEWDKNPQYYQEQLNNIVAYETT